MTLDSPALTGNAVILILNMNKKKRRLKNVFRVLPGVKTEPPQKGPPIFTPAPAAAFLGVFLSPKN
jgi:hypothetical protein